VVPARYRAAILADRLLPALVDRVYAGRAARKKTDQD
jgi:hypothetical protein